MGTLKNRTGQKFGRLTVVFLKEIGNHGAVWHCVCECGNEVDVFGFSLKSGRTKSCGCYHSDVASRMFKKNLSGMRFGRLVVLSEFPERKYKCVQWICKCDCGSQIIASSRCLMTGGTKSCGCYNKQRTTETHLHNLTGERIGRLVVICRSDKKNNRGSVYWKCKCDCGNIIDAESRSLTRGDYVSCGCYKNEMVKKRQTTHGLSYTREYKLALETRRREREIIFDSRWTVHHIVAIKKFFDKCVVCGGTDRLAIDHVYPITAGRGLEPGNAVRLCIHCNARKSKKNPETLPKNIREKLFDAAKRFKVYYESIGDAQ